MGHVETGEDPVSLGFGVNLGADVVLSDFFLPGCGDAAPGLVHPVGAPQSHP